ncbi:MAG: hypothetical protein AB8H80_14605 [Planctomycetota bacterium]
MNNRRLPKIFSAAIPGLLLLATATATGQEPNVLPLAKSYHVGAYSGRTDATSSEQELAATIGELTFQPNGTFAGLIDNYETNLVTGTIANLADPVGGTYTVRGDGIAVLDVDPSNPGTDTAPFWITPSGNLIYTATGTSNSQAQTILAIETSTGLGNATLSGTYAFERQTIEFVGGVWNVQRSFGTVVFDGAGGANISQTTTLVTPTATTTSPAATGTETYSVASDGSVSIGGDQGAVTADGELLFAVLTGSSGRVGMVIAIRIDTSNTLGDIAGRFGMISNGFDLDTSAFTPRSRTLSGSLDFTENSPSIGTWAADGVAVDSRPQGLQSNPITPNTGAATLLPSSGELTLAALDSGTAARVSASGRYLLGSTASTDSSQLFAARLCSVSNPIGTATAGTGGIEPLLGMRTFPTLGNASFAFAIENGLGGAFAALPIALAPAPGIPALGGVLWIDPTAVGTVASALLSGTAGAAGVGSGLSPFAIPANPALAGFELFAQALVFDAAAPGNLAMSRGYRVTLCP